MRRSSTTSVRTAAAAVGICVAMACALGNWTAQAAATNAATAKTPAKKTSTQASTPPPAQPTGPVMPLPPRKNLSAFSTDDPRDPFHPQIHPKAAAATVLAGPQSEAEQPALITAIQAGFQGIYGSGEDRDLLVYGVLLRENHEAVVVVPVSGQQRRLKIKALKVFRNYAELQVEGVPQKITVPKTR